MKQRDAVLRVFVHVDVDDQGRGATVHLPEPGEPPGDDASGAAVVGALYQASALGLVKLAYVMLGDLPGAEDVVQEAFCGLYRRWDRLKDADSAMYYVRASVLNGCRSALRRRVVAAQAAGRSASGGLRRSGGS